MTTIQIKVHKKTADARFGIQLAQHAGSFNDSSSTSRIFVEHMDSDSIFVDTDLKVGMELLEIDLHGLSGKSPIDAAKMLQDSPPGDILIVARDHSRRSNPEDESMAMRTIQLSIFKESQEDPLGLVLTQNPNSSQILIKQILANGAVSKSTNANELVVGMQLAEINLQGLAGKSVHDAVQMLRQAAGDVMLVARGNIVTVRKTNGDLGIVLQQKIKANGVGSELVVEKVAGLFANSGLQPRQKIASVNDVVLGPDATKDEVMDLLLKTPVGQPVTMVTLNSEALQEQQEAPPEQAPPRRVKCGTPVVLNVDQKEQENSAPVNSSSSTASVVQQAAPQGFGRIQVTRSAGTGVSLGMTQEYVYIHKIAPTSPFANSELQEGQHVVQIQGSPCPLSLSKAMNMLASGSPLTLEVLEKANGGAAPSSAAPNEEAYKQINATIVDKQADEDLGITLALTQNYVYVHSIKPTSRFVATDLCVGHRIVKIDGEDCPSSLKDTLELISQHVGNLEIEAYETVFSENQASASFVKQSTTSSVGIAVAMSQQGRVVITRISPSGPLASSALKQGQMVWSINGMKCVDTAGATRLLESVIGKVSIVASDTVVKVVKEHIDHTTGISVGKRGAEGNVLVAKIAKDGLFAKTNLKEGQKIISICGVACPSDIHVAAGLIQDCVGTCTIVAQDTLPELVQQ